MIGHFSSREPTRVLRSTSSCIRVRGEDALRFHLLFKESRPEQRRGVQVPLPDEARMSFALEVLQGLLLTHRGPPRRGTQCVRESWPGVRSDLLAAASLDPLPEEQTDPQLILSQTGWRVRGEK